MIINPCAEYSREIAALLADVAPADYPLGDLSGDVASGAVMLLTLSDNGGVKAALAYRVSVLGGRTHFEVLAMNAKRAPMALRAAWAALENMAALAGRSRVSAMIETDGMARFVERVGMHVRAALYVKDFEAA